MIDLVPLPPEARSERLRAEISGLMALEDRRDWQADLAAICEVFDAWSQAASPWREELEERVPRASGFSPEVVRAGLRAALGSWTGAAFRRLFEAELAASRATSKHEARAFELTSVLLAGSIPMPTITSLLFPLALGSRVLARPASRDPVTPEVVARSLEAIAPQLARRLRVVSFPSDDEACMQSFCASPCVVASGSDETLTAVRAHTTAAQRFVGYGHRLSIAVIGDAVAESEAQRNAQSAPQAPSESPIESPIESPTGSPIESLADRLARDICLWDQQGCLSPVAIYLLGSSAAAARARSLRLGGALADSLARQSEIWPRGETFVATASAIRRARDDLTFRAAAGSGASLYASNGTRWTVAVEDDANWREAPLGRFIRLHPISLAEGDETSAALVAAIEPIRRHLSTAAVDGFSPETRARIEAVLELSGVSRVCLAGEMQAPPLDWKHDGWPPLRPLLASEDFFAG